MVVYHVTILQTVCVISDTSVPVCDSCTKREVIIINTVDELKTYNESDMLALIDNNEDDSILNNYNVVFVPSELFFTALDVGSGKVVNITLTNRLGKSSEFTLYFEVEGKTCINFFQSQLLIVEN